MQFKVLIYTLFIPVVLFSQERGIHFQTLSDWHTVVKKAKQEHKLIFIDCYATWCGPCRAMEKKVYNIDSIGNFFNRNFISIKLQFDTTRSDSEQVKKWYVTAHNLIEKYQVEGFPTFIFLSADEMPLFMASGGFAPDQFMSMAKYALDPEEQYYTLLMRFRKGERGWSLVSRLARLAQVFHNDTEAEKMANEYINSLGTSDLYKEENISFIRDFTQNSKERGFDLFYHHSDTIDLLMKQSQYAETYVDYIVDKEEITPTLLLASASLNDPNWRNLTAGITEKYTNEIAERTVLKAQIRWYGYKKKWIQYCQFVLAYNEKNLSRLSAIQLNDDAWAIFQHSNDSSTLMKAMGWCDRNLQQNMNDAATLDTYANLLYKLGRIGGALVFEEKAIMISPDDEEVKENLKKMKSDTPTWEK